MNLHTSAYLAGDFVLHMFEDEASLLWHQLHLYGVQVTELLVAEAQDVGVLLSPQLDAERLHVRQVPK